MACGLVFDPRAQLAGIAEVVTTERNDAIPKPADVDVDVERPRITFTGYRQVDRVVADLSLIVRLPPSAWVSWPPILRWHVDVRDGTLSSRGWPLDVESRSIPVSEIDQLFCRHGKFRSKRDEISFVYSVEVMLKSGATMTLVRHLRDPRQALFVERAIEDALGIQDRIVTGELTGD